MADNKVRETFRARELAVCLSYYDLGIISEIEEFARGSRRAPKVVIDCERGRFLFKRRTMGKDDLAKVAFTHQIQLTLLHEIGHHFGFTDEEMDAWEREFEGLAGGEVDS